MRPDANMATTRQMATEKSGKKQEKILIGKTIDFVFAECADSQSTSNCVERPTSKAGHMQNRLTTIRYRDEVHVFRIRHPALIRMNELLFNEASTAKGYQRQDAVEKPIGVGTQTNPLPKLTSQLQKGQKDCDLVLSTNRRPVSDKPIAYKVLNILQPKKSQIK